ERRSEIANDVRAGWPYAVWLRSIEFNSSTILACRLRFTFPKDIDDFPFAVELCFLQVIDPIGRNDFDHGDIVVAIQHRTVFLLLFLWCLCADPGSPSLHECHRAHRI